MPGGEVEVGCGTTVSTPQVPIPVPIFIPVYVRAELSLALSVALGISGWAASGPLWDGSFNFEPGVEGVLGAGYAGVACVEGYLGGKFSTGVQFLPELEWLNSYVTLLGGVRAVLGPFHADAPLSYTWPDQGGQVGP